MHYVCYCAHDSKHCDIMVDRRMQDHAGEATFCIIMFWVNYGDFSNVVTETIITRQSEMADLARRATRWVGTCHTGMCMSNFMMIGLEMAEILHIEISRKHVSVTYDLDL